MVGDAESIEPEERQAGEHPALVGNARRQHPVEGADAVGGDDYELVAQVVYVPHLAAPARETADVAFEQHRHGEPPGWMENTGGRESPVSRWQSGRDRRFSPTPPIVTGGRSPPLQSPLF